MGTIGITSIDISENGQIISLSDISGDVSLWANCNISNINLIKFNNSGSKESLDIFPPSNIIKEEMNENR